MAENTEKEAQSPPGWEGSSRLVCVSGMRYVCLQRLPCLQASPVQAALFKLFIHLQASFKFSRGFRCLQRCLPAIRASWYLSWLSNFFSLFMYFGMGGTEVMLVFENPRGPEVSSHSWSPR